MYVIGEAGTWHAADGEQERVELAYELIDTAADCGVDAVKFQCFTEGELFCPLDGDEERWKHWRRTFLTEEQWSGLKGYAEEKGIDFLLSAFQLETVDWCVRMNLKWYKVASRAALTYPYERVPGSFLISDGMLSDFDHIPTKNAQMMQCAVRYPTPLIDCRWVGPLPDEDFERGLSDHSGTPWPAIDALARGCPVVEVHFSQERGVDSANPDFEVSLPPPYLRLICDARDAFREMRNE